MHLRSIRYIRSLDNWGFNKQGLKKRVGQRMMSSERG